MDRQIVAMCWDLGSAVSSQQQAASEHVQKSASREPQQQKQLQDPPQQQRASVSCSRCQRGCCSTLPWLMTHRSHRLPKVQTGEHVRALPRKHHQSWRRTFALHRHHDKSLQSITKYYDDIHKNLQDDVMSFNDAVALPWIGERMMKDQNAL